MSKSTLIDRITDKRRQHMKDTGRNPKFIIISYEILLEIKANFKDLYWPSYQQLRPEEADKVMGLDIAICTGSNKDYLEVA